MGISLYAGDQGYTLVAIDLPAQSGNGRFPTGPRHHPASGPRRPVRDRTAALAAREPLPPVEFPADPE